MCKNKFKKVMSLICAISNNEESNGDVEMKKQIFDTPHILHE